MVTVAEISDRLVDEYATVDPIAGAEMGVDINTAYVPDYSPAGVERLGALLESASRHLDEAVDADEAGRLGRLFMVGWLSSSRDLLALGEWKRELSVLSGPPARLRQSFDLALPRTVEDWEAIAGRMERVPAALAGYRESLAMGLEQGNVASERAARGVLAQCRRWGEGGWFGGYASGVGEVPHAVRLRTAATNVDAAYIELARWLSEEYLPRASGREGVGSEAYQVWARHCLGTDLDIDEAYAWGWEELERLQLEQSRVCAAIEPGASFLAIRDVLASDPARLVQGEDSWKAWLQELTDSTIARLQGTAFDIPAPLRTCRVCIPPEGTAATPYYLKPSEDMSRPGSIWFPSMGRSVFPTWDAPTTVFHEAVPGHHLQLGTAQLTPLTRFHSLMGVSSHIEGWALYAERFMDELGAFVRDDYRLGFLSMQVMRAARVVIDIGLHTGRGLSQGRPHAGEPWAFDLAVEFLEEASGNPRDFAESEVERYLVWPSQATSYKLGERAWLHGREQARTAQGAGFDLRSWHRDVLAIGSLGLDDLAGELERVARAGSTGDVALQ